MKLGALPPTVTAPKHPGQNTTVVQGTLSVGQRLPALIFSNDMKLRVYRLSRDNAEAEEKKFPKYHLTERV